MSSTFETYLLDQEGMDVIDQAIDELTDLHVHELPQGFWTEL